MVHPHHRPLRLLTVLSAFLVAVVPADAQTSGWTPFSELEGAEAAIAGASCVIPTRKAKGRRT